MEAEGDTLTVPLTLPSPRQPPPPRPPPRPPRPPPPPASANPVGSFYNPVVISSVPYFVETLDVSLNENWANWSSCVRLRGRCARPVCQPPSPSLPERASARACLGPSLRACHPLLPRSTSLLKPPPPLGFCRPSAMPTCCPTSSSLRTGVPRLAGPRNGLHRRRVPLKAHPQAALQLPAAKHRAFPLLPCSFTPSQNATLEVTSCGTVGGEGDPFLTIAYTEPSAPNTYWCQL